MDITIIGAGNVGQALGAGWRKCGHDVVYALRAASGKNADTVAAQGFRVVSLKEAADADVVVLAVPWPAVAEALQAAGSLAGKIVIDATNPLTRELELALGFNDSAGETVARLTPAARVVKAFNTTGAGNMATAHAFAAKPMMPLAGDDAEAKTVVAKLAEELGFEAIDAGRLTAARLLEPLAMFWIKLAYAQNFGRNFAFSVIRRER
ncbi:MAG TPA: NADPH-dependent F420 reductase [Xanthobacteraceae bacterium]|jgi:predicted dinucleotide-binding enzyme|nr:NADPH-dependent F420 reductase [Xanthobacteraceae bacterium]